MTRMAHDLTRPPKARRGERIAVLSPSFAAAGAFPAVHEQAMRRLTVFEQMAQVHPAGEHWFLPLIGVDPVAQGRGLGSALLRHGLAPCDRDGLPAYLEATSPGNRALYERHGFRVIEVLQAGSSPPMWAMLREPRSGGPGHTA